MILEEYDEELHIRNEKEISYEDGLQDGIQQGIEQGIEQGIDSLIADALRNGKTCEEITGFLGIPVERAREVEEKINS